MKHRETIQKVLGLIRPYRWKVIAMLILAAVTVALTLYTPILIGDAVDQIVDLISNGVEGIHLYTMNNPQVARRIWDNVSSLL